MVSCPYCNSSIESEKFNYCPSCEKQIRCRKCNEPLVANKNKCLVCGAQIVETEENQTSYNRYHYEEKISNGSTYKRIEFTFSDSAIDKAIPLFINQIPGIIIKSEYLQGKGEDKLVLPINPDHEIDSFQEDTKALENKTENINLGEKIFVKENDGFLISQNPDYKGNSKKQQQERFILLYIYEYFREFNEGATREHIIDAANRNGLIDSNFRNYFLRFENNFIKTNECYRLNPTGQKLVLQIINEIHNEKLTGFAYWDAPKQRNKRTVQSKEEKEAISQWLTQPSELQDFDIRGLKTNAEICMFGLFDLTRIMKVANGVKPLSVFQYLQARYKTLSLTNKQFSNTLYRKDNSDKFQRTPDGLYFLTQKGEELIKGIIYSGTQ